MAEINKKTNDTKPKKVYIGGDNKFQTRVNYLKIDPELNKFIHQMAYEYDIPLDAFYQRIQQEGLIDRRIRRINYKGEDSKKSILHIPYENVNLHNDYGLNTIWDDLEMGFVKPHRSIPIQKHVLKDKNGNIQNSGTVKNHKDAIELYAARMAYDRDNAKNFLGSNANADDISLMMRVMYRHGKNGAIREYKRRGKAVYDDEEIRTPNELESYLEETTNDYVVIERAPNKTRNNQYYKAKSTLGDKPQYEESKQTLNKYMRTSNTRIIAPVTNTRKYALGGDVTYGSEWTPGRISDSDVNAGGYSAINIIGGAAAGAVSGLGTVASATALGASLGSAAPGIGTAIGAAVGLIVGGIQAIFGVKKRKRLEAEARERQRQVTISNIEQKAENDVYQLRQDSANLGNAQYNLKYGGIAKRRRYDVGGDISKAVIHINPNEPIGHLPGNYGWADSPTITPDDYVYIDPILTEEQKEEYGYNPNSKNTSSYFTSQNYNVNRKIDEPNTPILKAMASMAAQHGEGTIDKDDETEFLKKARVRWAKAQEHLEKELHNLREASKPELDNDAATNSNKTVSNIAAFGGRFNPATRVYPAHLAYGGVVQNSSDTAVAYGQTHEQYDPETQESGVPYKNIEVEGGGMVGNKALAGEVIKQTPVGDLVFSNRLKVPGLKQSYAKLAKGITDIKGGLEKAIVKDQAVLNKALNKVGSSRMTVALRGSLFRNIEKIAGRINSNTADVAAIDDSLYKLYSSQEQVAGAMGLRNEDGTPTQEQPKMKYGGCRRKYLSGGAQFGIQAGAQAILGLTNYFNARSNAKFYKNLPTPKIGKTSAPVYEWQYNERGEIEDINRSVKTTENYIKKNTSNAQVARNLIVNANIQGSRLKGQVYAKKNQIEQQGRNRNIEARYQNNLRNIQAAYQNEENDYNKLVTYNQMKGDATAGLIGDLQGIVAGTAQHFYQQDLLKALQGTALDRGVSQIQGLVNGEGTVKTKGSRKSKKSAWVEARLNQILLENSPAYRAASLYGLDKANPYTIHQYATRPLSFVTGAGRPWSFR